MDSRECAYRLTDLRARLCSRIAPKARQDLQADRTRHPVGQGDLAPLEDRLGHLARLGSMGEPPDGLGFFVRLSLSLSHTESREI